MIEGLQAVDLISRRLRLLPLNQPLKIIILKVKYSFCHVCMPLGLIISLSITGEESPNSSETLEKRKKKYSEKLYQWTQEMWNNTRRDIE